jgi:predicted nuclease of predicted toxin-antitoxin system
VDACVDIRVGNWLRERGYDAVHLRDQGLKRLADREVFEKASAEKRVLITFDLDFSEIAALSGGRTVSVIVLRIRNPRFDHMVGRLASVLANSGRELKRGAVITVEESRYRVRFLPIGAR